MTSKVELIQISDGSRITVKENGKIIVGRESSLGVFFPNLLITYA
jgi:hypothetical protein